ncbi:MAG: AAA family ATPase [Acidobacteria bacterium]|nr:AAA family ATPase [Acidobacteriota bacterium]
MKVAFIGTHGVGKTTLGYGLAMRLKQLGANVGFLEEVARRCPLPINESTSVDAQTWILMETVRREIELQELYTEVVCDRSVIDNYCYLEFGAGRREALFAMAAYWATTYDILFKVPIRPEYLQNDGTRSTDRAFQRAIDEKLDALLEETGVDYVEFNGLEDAVERARLVSGRLPIA